MRCYGGGISVDFGSSLRLVNSTVTGNDADYAGGGIASRAHAGATLTTMATSTDHRRRHHVGRLSADYGGGHRGSSAGGGLTTRRR